MAKRRKVGDDFNISDDEKISRKKEIISNILLTKVNVSGKNESQIKLIKSIKDNEITICRGIAGSGKTFVSLAYALSLIKNNDNKLTRIYLVKSVTTLKNEEMGFLKGDLREKFDPYVMSFKINAEKVIDEKEMQSLFAADILIPFPLAYIKGSSLDNSIIIADEMQNVSLDNCRILMTRLGTNSKLILLGDSSQIDLKDKTESCLAPLFEMFEEVDSIGTITMDENDENCRNPLIKIIENKFKEHYEENKSIKLNKDYGRRKKIING